MPDVLEPQVVDQITSTNAKMLADMAQTAMGLSVQNAVALQQQMNSIATANLQNGLTLSQNIMSNAVNLANATAARATRFTFDISAEEAVAFSKQIASDLSEKVAEMGASLASIQEYTKIAQSTPPETAVATAMADLAASMATVEALLKNARPAGG